MKTITPAAPLPSKRLKETETAGDKPRPWLYDPMTTPRGVSIIRPEPYSFDLFSTLAKYSYAVDHVPVLALTPSQHKTVRAWCTWGSKAVGMFKFLKHTHDTGLSITRIGQGITTINTVTVHEED